MGEILQAILEFVKRNYFLFLKLSITTVNSIKPPPIKVLELGISFTKINAIIIPNMGWILLIIVAVAAEKCFKDFTIIVWPIAVVKTASNIKYGSWLSKPEISTKNKTGANKTEIMIVW